MKKFISSVFSSFIGVLLAAFVLFFFFFVLIFGLFSGLGEKESIRIHDKAVLRIDINGPLPDRGSDEPRLVFSGNDFDLREQTGLRHLIKSIEMAGDDERIRGIYLHLGMVAPGAATLEELRSQLSAFKAKGKFIVAYAEMLGEANYYLGSVADLLALHPAGLFEFNGLSSERVFFKRALDRLGVKVQVFYVGKYKSATEPFRYEHMSDASREQTRALLRSRKDHELSAIAASRGMPVEQLDSLQRELAVFSPGDALQAGLADTLVYVDELYKIMKRRAGIDPDSSDERLQIVPLMKYYEKLKSDGKFLDLGPDTMIAVVYAEGEIVTGKGEDGKIGSDTYIETLRKLRENDRVGAVVLRVNSPGGSALASDAIWREIVLLRREKPVVVSMGNLAASGGYYISAGADKIFAQSNTITGSIGIFGLWLNMGELLTEKLGITSDTVKTAPYADAGNVFRSMNPREEEVIQGYVNSGYRMFLEKVAQGRSMPVEEVHQIAQGRVWSGSDALEIGLVDQIGGLNDAIAEAADLAGIRDYYTEIYPRQKKFLDKLSDIFGSEAGVESWLNSEEMKPFRTLIDNAGMLSGSGEHLFYRMPYDLIIR